MAQNARPHDRLLDRTSGGTEFISLKLIPGVKQIQTETSQTIIRFSTIAKGSGEMSRQHETTMAALGSGYRDGGQISLRVDKRYSAAAELRGGDEA